MKKCMIMLTVLITALLISMIAENKEVEMPENTIASTNTEREYSALKSD